MTINPRPVKEKCEFAFFFPVFTNLCMKMIRTFPLKCLAFGSKASGAVKAGVPAVEFNLASDPSNSLHTPKSAICT